VKWSHPLVHGARIDQEELKKRIAAFLEFRFEGARGVDCTIQSSSIRSSRSCRAQTGRVKHGRNRRPLAAPEVGAAGKT